MSERRFYSEKRKTPGKETINNAPVDNGPDRVQPAKGTIYFAKNGKNTGLPNNCDRHGYDLERPHTEEHVVFEDAMQVVMPLVSFKRVRWGGGRVYGGGTSKEAIRRAKRKSRRTTKPGLPIDL